MYLLTLKILDGFLYEFSPRIAGLETAFLIKYKE